MAYNFYDRVKETSTSTGTTDFALAGAVSPPLFSSFTSRFALGEPFYYAIVGQTGTEWEVGRSSLSGTTTLVRNGNQVVLASSNSDAAVNFGASTKDVFVTIPAFEKNRIFTKGKSAALVAGAAMP